MDSKSLMIGDWVLLADGPASVISIAQDGIYFEDKFGRGVCSFDKIQPISLTAEILEKNGFEICNKDTDGAIQYELGSPASGIDIWINTKPCLLGAWRTWEGETKSYTMVEELPINFIHELQHALSLCGIEKSIEL